MLCHLEGSAFLCHKNSNKKEKDGSSKFFYPETISIIFLNMFLSTSKWAYVQHQNVLKAIILISSLETISPPDACQKLGLQRIMEENCTDQMFKTVTVPTKYCLEQNQNRCSVWMLQTTLVTGPRLLLIIFIQAAAKSKIMKHWNIAVATAQLLMIPESYLVYLCLDWTVSLWIFMSSLITRKRDRAPQSGQLHQTPYEWVFNKCQSWMDIKHEGHLKPVPQ